MTPEPEQSSNPPLDRPCVGKVFLVGAGPGDPGLLTLRGHDCLRRADVVIYDYLVNPRFLEFAAAKAERYCVGQHGRSRHWTQTEINSRMVEFAQAGKTVVRLKGGDTAVFARSAEESAELARQGIPFEVVPGITAALAVGSYAGISLTHRESASAVAFVTGQEDADKSDSSLDFAALASFPGTLVFYMGVTTARHWSDELLRAGKPADTPVAIVRRCSLPDQRVLSCTLGTLADTLSGPPRIRPPAICVVGVVAQEATCGSWFSRRPLFGQRILVTRPDEQVDGLRRPLEELGAEVLVQPAIEIGPPRDWGPLDDALRRIADFQWLVFSSVNGVRSFCDRLLSLDMDTRALGHARLAVIGPGTADELRRYSLRPDLMPDEYRAEALAAELAAKAGGQSLLLIRASRGREVLAETLRAAGSRVEQVVAYESRDVAQAAPEVAQALADGLIHWTTVTSSAIARSLVNLFGEALRNTQLASISPITSATLRELGYAPAVEASTYTMAGVVDAINLA